MKRNVCQNHLHFCKVEGRPITLSIINCSVCKRENRPSNLKDTAMGLESVAENMRFAYDNPDYDPNGITYMSELIKTLNRFYKILDPSYRERFIDYIKKLK
jgi:hypothetical protein